jgi:hypothetical protein
MIPSGKAHNEMLLPRKQMKKQPLRHSPAAKALV